MSDRPASVAEIDPAALDTYRYWADHFASFGRADMPVNVTASDLAILLDLYRAEKRERISAPLHVVDEAPHGK